MKILGIVDGIGSMMIGARKPENEIVGNIEWRPYYHTGTFQKNFPGAFLVKDWADLTPEQSARIQDIDLVIGHPECGSFSNLNSSVKAGEINKMDIPVFIDSIKRVKPKFFAADNLPKSLLSVPLTEWQSELPDYKIELAWVSNYNYGNVQKFRNRLFIIGSLKELNFTFIPGEFPNDKQLIDVIGDLPEEDDIPEWNHIHLKDDDLIFDLCSHNIGLPGTFLEFKRFKKQVKNNPADFLPGKNWGYYNKLGEKKIKPGYTFARLEHTCPVITGHEDKYRADTYLPFTIRERARIQGIPDDFIFLPVIPESKKDRLNLVKQTGKCMPVQFCTYLTDQFQAFLEGEEFETTGKSLLKPNTLISEILNKNNQLELELCVDSQ